MHGLRILQVSVPSDDSSLSVVKLSWLGSFTLKKVTRSENAVLYRFLKSKRAALGILLGKDMHAGLCRNISQHDLEIAGSGEFTSSARLISYAQLDPFYRKFLVYEYAQFRGDPLLGVLKMAIAKAVRGDVGCGTASGERRRRPE